VFRRGTIALLMIMLVWTLSDLFTSPARKPPDLNAVFLLVYVGLIALCYARISWGFMGAMALSLFRMVVELPTFEPLPEQGVLFFAFRWSGAIWGVILYLTRFAFQTALIYVAYRGYSALESLVLD